MATIVAADEFGGPEVLKLETTEVPAPGPGEVKIAVRAIGVNPVDAKVRSGAFGGSPPVRFGAEAAGVVVEVGEGVEAVAVGDEVIAYRVPGAYASDLVVPAADVVAKPSSLSWQQAAGLLLVGATAVHALEKTRVGEGDVVLVHGAAGGVGQMVLQLAALRGATVIGTASASSADLVRELGATPVEYGPGLADRVRAVAPQGVDVALDLIGTSEAIDVSLELVADRSRLTTIVGGAAADAAGIQKIGGGPGSDPGTELRNAARADLARLAGEGRLVVRVEAAYPLEEVAQAHRLLERGHAHGKIVLLP